LWNCFATGFRRFTPGFAMSAGARFDASRAGAKFYAVKPEAAPPRSGICFYYALNLQRQAFSGKICESY